MGATGGTLVLSLLVGVLMRISAKKHVQKLYASLQRADAAARDAARVEAEEGERQIQAKLAAAAQQAKSEVLAARQKFQPIIAKAAATRDGKLQIIQADFSKKLAAFEEQRTKSRAEADASLQRHLADHTQRQGQESQAAQQKNAQQLQSSKRQYEEAKATLRARLQEGLARIQAPIEEKPGAAPAPLNWNDPAWKTWIPPKQFAAMVQFGSLQVDLKRIADSVPCNSPLQLELPPTFSMPAALAFPSQASLLMQTDRDARDSAIRTLQMLMARLLTSLPPGRVRFTIIDPVGLGQNFAGFMHLADYDEALVGGRIWTSGEQIEQRLADLTEHMETVIQKYLRNEFETIDDYNAQAGELAEPYRFLIIADFPVGFSDEAMKRLSSIAASGARCGVYTLIMRDTRQPLPSGTHLDDLEHDSVNLVQEADRLVWNDDVFRQFPLILDGPPTEDFLTQILHVVGEEAKRAKRVEVPFDTIAPSPDEIWSRSTAEDLLVPIGRMGATRLQYMRLGRGVAQHVLIAGKTGSGKSTLLHALVTNLAMWYSPDEVEFYLIDFKKGVEFKTYATHALPHARAIAVESDREFGLSVLQRLDAELGRRGDLFRKAGVQDLASYRPTPNAVPMPRTLLVIDEFQEFFSEDDKLAQDAALLLDRLVRQGRAFGVHVLLGSQTIGGTSGLSRSTIGQMAVRIALQTSEADSQIILGDGNSAARLLSRPGEAIYNDAGGLVESNSPFQIAWLTDAQRERFLAHVQSRAAKSASITANHPAPIVFEGNAAADIAKNPQLARLLESPSWNGKTSAAAWLGEPVAIKDPTAINFRRQSGSNMIIVGQQEESALAILASALLSIAAQQSPAAAIFYVLDGTPADSPLAAVFPRIKEVLPHTVNLIDYRAVADMMNELAQEMQRRQAAEIPDAPSIYLIINGLQRYRMLRKQEDSSFSFSAGDEDKPPAPEKQFADLLREGPPNGMHVLAFSDTLVSLDRTLDRNAMREFDNRILFQMSAADSSNLIDSPVANKMGFYRALAYSEEQGVMEKFRPYALPVKSWLETVKNQLASRALTPVS